MKRFAIFLLSSVFAASFAHAQSLQDTYVVQPPVSATGGVATDPPVPTLPGAPAPTQSVAVPQGSVPGAPSSTPQSAQTAQPAQPAQVMPQVMVPYADSQGVPQFVGVDAQNWQGQAVPPLTDNSSMNPARAQGFNDAIETLFPMTPDMIRQFQQIYNNSQEAILSRPEPRAVIGAGMVSLEPGAAPPTLNVVPGIASVVTLFDATGQAWPIEQYIVGNGAAFQIIQLGENPNSFTVTPQVPVGWTNIVVKLAGEPTPVVLRVLVNKDSAHYRHDIQVLAMGPNAEPVMAATQADLGPRAGDAVLLAALTGVDLPPDARPVGVAGVAASAWMTSGDLYVRSRVPLISPSWTSSLAGPDGVRVYRMSPSPVLLFSNDGQVVRATVELP